jgi:glutathione S-transferase
MELYLVSGSPYSWRVQLALEAKHAEYTVRMLSLANGDLAGPTYRSLNPRGRVPLLVDGVLTIRESLAILAYLERKIPEPPVFGRSPAETALVWQSAIEYQSYLDAAVEDYILPLYFGAAKEKTEQLRSAVSRIEGELTLLEATLARTPFLAGEAYTAADMTVFPGIMSIDRASKKPDAARLGVAISPLERFANVGRWTKRIEAMPGYERTYPPHWRA